MTFDEANKVDHPVEKQWHYPILTRHGYVPKNKSAVGFVRAYTYVNPDGNEITCNTGASADYWSDKSGGYGYWADLENHLLT